MNPTTPEDPTLKPSKDGIYPRCVYCNGEIYGPAVYPYSLGEIGCGAVNGCGKKLPDEYIKIKEERARYE